MPDPSNSFSERNSPLHGAGPYQFNPADFGVATLNPGVSATLDLREYEENGTKGYYTVISEKGYNVLQVRNSGTADLSVEVNETWNIDVPAASIQTLSQPGMYRFRIRNEDTVNSLPSKDVSIQIQQEAFGSDDKARSDVSDPVWKRVIKGQLGL